MTSERLVTVATFGNPQEAHLARATLASEGIGAFVQGDAIGTTLWHVGTALGGVKVQVSDADFDRARNALESVDQQNGRSVSTQDWTCLDCGAEVDAGFDVCWSCGAPITDATTAMALAPPPSGNEPSTRLTAEPESRTVVSEDADSRVRRAWKSAICSIVFTPLMIYSVILLLGISAESLSPEGRQIFRRTAILQAAVLGFLVITVTTLVLI